MHFKILSAALAALVAFSALADAVATPTKKHAPATPTPSMNPHCNTNCAGLNPTEKLVCCNWFATVSGCSAKAAGC